MSAWHSLDAELERWSDAGGVATFWWRDDDAQAPGRALATLLELSESHGVPLALAAIPSKAGEALREMLAPTRRAVVFQHGFAHANHAPPERKKSEYGAHRPLGVMGEEIGAGARRLRSLFGPRFVPVLVPPWNRLARELVPLLPSLGLSGLSTFGARDSSAPAPGLRQVNTHVDLIDWRGGRVFKGTARAADELAAHLAARRGSQSDPGEPSGILSHHLVHDPDCWRFLEQLFIRTRARQNVRWLTPSEAVDA